MDALIRSNAIMIEQPAEQIIEFPIPAERIFDGALIAHAGFCIAYQYDIDSHGYGPYGFDKLTVC